jgi:sulfoxide reductase heme-binding subunit YedZ
MDPGTHLLWITTRAAGITALILASVSICVGLLFQPSSSKGRSRLRVAHEALSLAALAAIGLHGVALLGDSWLKPGLAGVLVPFQGSYRPLWTGVGIIAGYGIAALGLTYYLRGRIGARRWARMHRWVAVFWVLAIVHGLGAGTDAGRPWFLLLVSVVTIPPLAMLATRHLGAPKRGAASPSGAA